MTGLAGFRPLAGGAVTVDTGTGTPMVLLHGVGASSSYWADLVALLPDRRCIGLDFPQAPSGTPDEVIGAMVKAACEVCLQVDVPVVLVAHSLGGAIAILAAGVLGDSVSHLVLLDTAGLGRELNPFVMLAGSALGRGAMRLPYSPLGRRLVRGLQAEPGGSRPELDRLYRQLDDPQARRNLHRTIRSVRAYQRSLPYANPDRLLSAHPTLLIWGEDDLVLPLFQATRTAARHPNIELVVIPGAGHTPQVTHPRAVATAIEAFLDRTGPG